MQNQKSEDMQPGGRNSGPRRSETANGGRAADSGPNSRSSEVQGRRVSRASLDASADAAAPAAVAAAAHTNAPVPAEPQVSPLYRAPSTVGETTKPRNYFLGRFQQNEIIRTKAQFTPSQSRHSMGTLQPRSSVPPHVVRSASTASAGPLVPAADEAASGSSRTPPVPAQPQSAPTAPGTSARSSFASPITRQSQAQESSQRLHRNRSASLGGSPIRRPSTTASPVLLRERSASLGPRVSSSSYSAPSDQQRKSSVPALPPIPQRVGLPGNESRAPSLSSLNRSSRDPSPRHSIVLRRPLSHPRTRAQSSKSGSLVFLEQQSQLAQLQQSEVPPTAPPLAAPQAPAPALASTNEVRDDETLRPVFPLRTSLNTILERPPTTSDPTSPVSTGRAVPNGLTVATVGSTRPAFPRQPRSQQVVRTSASESDDSPLTSSSSRRIVPKSMAMRRNIGPRKRRPLLLRRSRSPTPRTSADPSPSISQAAVAPSASAGALTSPPLPTPPPTAPAPTTPAPMQALPPIPLPTPASRLPLPVPTSLITPVPQRASYVVPARAPTPAPPRSSSSIIAIATTSSTATAAASRTPSSPIRYPRLAVYASDTADPQPLEIVEWHVSRGDLVVTCAPASPPPRQASEALPRSRASLDASTQEGEPMREVATQDEHPQRADAATDPHAAHNSSRPIAPTTDVATNPPSARIRFGNDVPSTCAQGVKKSTEPNSNTPTTDIPREETTVAARIEGVWEPKTISSIKNPLSYQTNNEKDSLYKEDLGSPKPKIDENHSSTKLSSHWISKEHPIIQEPGLLPVATTDLPVDQSKHTDERKVSPITQEQDSISTPAPTTNTDQSHISDANDDSHTHNRDIKSAVKEHLVAQNNDFRKKPVSVADVATNPPSAKLRNEPTNESSQTDSVLRSDPTRVQTAPPLQKRFPGTLATTFLTELTAKSGPTGGKETPSELPAVVHLKSTELPAEVRNTEVSSQRDKKDLTVQSPDKSDSKLVVDTTSNKNTNVSSPSTDLVFRKDKDCEKSVAEEGDMQKRNKRYNDKFMKFEEIVKNTTHPSKKDENFSNRSAVESTEQNEKVIHQEIKERDDSENTVTEISTFSKFDTPATHLQNEHSLKKGSGEENSLLTNKPNDDMTLNPQLQVSVTSAFQEFSKCKNNEGNLNKVKVINLEEKQVSLDTNPETSQTHHSKTDIFKESNDVKGIIEDLGTEQMVQLLIKTNENRSIPEIHPGKDNIRESNTENADDTKQNIVKQFELKDDRLAEGRDAGASIIEKPQSQSKAVPSTGIFEVPGDKMQDIENGALVDKTQDKDNTSNINSKLHLMPQTEQGNTSLGEHPNEPGEITNANESQKGVFSAPATTIGNIPSGPTFFGPAGAVWHLNKWSPSTSVTKTTSGNIEQVPQQELSEKAQIDQCSSEIIANEQKLKFIEEHSKDRDDEKSESKHNTFETVFKEEKGSFHISTDLWSTTREPFPSDDNALVDEKNTIRHDGLKQSASQSSIKHLTPATLLMNDSPSITRRPQEQKIQTIEDKNDLVTSPEKEDNEQSILTNKNTTKSLSLQSFHQQMKPDTVAVSSLKENLLDEPHHTSTLNTTEFSKECTPSYDTSLKSPPMSELYSKNQLSKRSSTFVPVSEYTIPQRSGEVSIQESDNVLISTRQQLFADPSTTSKVSSSKMKTFLDTTQFFTDESLLPQSKDVTDILITESPTTPAVSLTIPTPMQSSIQIGSDYDITGTLAKLAGRPATAPVPILRDYLTSSPEATGEYMSDPTDNSAAQGIDLTRFDETAVSSTPREHSVEPLRSPPPEASTSKVNISVKKAIILSSTPSQELGTISPHMVESSTTDSEYERMRLEEIEKTLRFRLPTTSLATTITKSEDGSSLVRKHSSKRTVVFAQNNETEALQKEVEPYTTEFLLPRGSSHLNFAIVPNANYQRSAQVVKIQPDQKYESPGNIPSFSLSSTSSVIRYLPAEKSPSSKSKNNQSPCTFGQNLIKSILRLSSTESESFHSKYIELEWETTDCDTSTLPRSCAEQSNNKAASKTSSNQAMKANDEQPTKLPQRVISSNSQPHYSLYTPEEMSSKSSVQVSEALADDSRLKLRSFDQLQQKNIQEVSPENELHSSAVTDYPESKELSHTKVTNDETLPLIHKEADPMSKQAVTATCQKSETINGPSHKTSTMQTVSDCTKIQRMESDTTKGTGPCIGNSRPKSPTPKQNIKKNIFGRFTEPNTSKSKNISNNAPASKPYKSKKTLVHRMSDVFKNQFKQKRSITRSPVRSVTRSPNRNSSTSGHSSNVKK